MSQITEIKRGTSEYWTVTIQDNGVGVDITGDIVKILIKKNQTDPDSSAVWSATMTDADHTDPLNGVTRKLQTASETISIANGVYFFAVKWYDSGGVLQTEYPDKQVSYTQNIIDNA